MSDNEIRHTSSTGGQKAGNDERYDLIPAMPLRKLARHFGVGAKKYDDDNWRKGYDWRLSFAAMMRHAWQFWAGEDIDEETGSPHLTAVAWHAMTLLEFTDIHPEFDTRLKTLDQRAVRKHAAPRQWDTLRDIPVDEVTRVVSAHGCHWRYWKPDEADDDGKVVIHREYQKHGQWLWSSASGDTHDLTGPFTEDTETNDSVANAELITELYRVGLLPEGEMTLTELMAVLQKIFGENA